MNKRNGYMAVWVEPNTEMLKNIAKLRKLAMFGIQKPRAGRDTPSKNSPSKKDVRKWPTQKDVR